MPSIALCVICKNEENNLSRFLHSIDGCFDEVHFTDTGSTDATISLLENYQSTMPNLSIHRFDWVNDFSAARNYSFSHAKTDYIMWMDLDDVLDNKEAFISFKDHVMSTADYWVATYHYGGIDANGNSPCKFMRERVIRNNNVFEWRFFVHEGLVSKNSVLPVAQYVVSWSIIHKRTEEDQKKDRSRNLKMFKGRTNLPPRMVYYYGKELFENQQPLEAYEQLIKASQSEELEHHDRVMAIQYACLAAMQCGQADKALHLAHLGLELAPNRAEFHVIIGDCLVKSQKIAEAIPFFKAATACAPAGVGIHAPVVFTHLDASLHHPRNQLARCYFHTNQLALAKEVLKEALSLGPNVETAQLADEIGKAAETLAIRDGATYEKQNEICITCIPNAVRDWDETTLQTVGLGGSETAVVHMARCLHDITGLRVRVFNDRKTAVELNGVSYEPLAHMYTYFNKNIPIIQIAWRHNIRMSPCPMYLWCHDLAFVGLEGGEIYDKVLALSEFHKNWLNHIYSVPKDKIIITRNGIDPRRFNGCLTQTNREPRLNRVVFSSSPDRGLENAMLVMDEVVKEIPDATLHVYYGLNLFKEMGRQADADKLLASMSHRPYVVYHGNITQSALTQELEEASVWLYPTNFLETFCITAIECLCAGVYPVVRKYGALPDTLRLAETAGMASIIDSANPKDYVGPVISALKEQKWRRVLTDPAIFSWESVAMEWVNFMGLPSKL